MLLTLNFKNPQSRYLILQGVFYFLVFVFYFERQINFDLYYSPDLVREFYSNVANFIVPIEHYSSFYDFLFVFHFAFLLLLLLSAINIKRTWTNVFLYSYNLLLLYVNYSSGYAIDIFIQLGLFFFMFCDPRSKTYSEDPYSVFSITMLRLYFSVNYLLSSTHKFLDMNEHATGFVETIREIQLKNNVPEIFQLGIYFDPSSDMIFSYSVIVLQIIGGLSLLFRKSYRFGIIILMIFHIGSVFLLNLVIFPLIVIVLLLISCLPDTFNIFSGYKKLLGRTNLT